MLPILARTAWRASATCRSEEGEDVGGRVEDSVEGGWGGLWWWGPLRGPGGYWGDEREDPAVDAAAGGETVLAWLAVVTVLGVVLVGGEVDVADSGDGWGGLRGGCWIEDAIVSGS